MLSKTNLLQLKQNSIFQRDYSIYETILVQREYAKYTIKNKLIISTKLICPLKLLSDEDHYTRITNLYITLHYFRKQSSMEAASAASLSSAMADMSSTRISQ